jgi:sulfur carrier protein
MITAKGQPMEWREGMTLEEVLLRLGYNLPIVIVTLNGSRVPRERWASTPIPDDAEVALFPMMAGG